MDQWVELGRRISVELQDGRRLNLSDRYRLAARADWGGAPFLVIPVADAKVLDGPAVDAFVEWTWGLEPGEACTAERPEGPGELVGLLAWIWYDSILAGELGRRVHKFSRPGPALVRCPEGLQLERRSWRGRVDHFGIRD